MSRLEFLGQPASSMDMKAPKKEKQARTSGQDRLLLCASEDWKPVKG